MRRIMTSTIVAAGLTGILAFGLCGCSSSSETTTTVETSVTDEDGNTETSKTTTTNKDGEVTTESETENILDVSSWSEAWIGTSENGQKLFYAQSPDTGEQGVFVIYDPKTKELIHAVGDNTTNEDKTEVTTTDLGGQTTVTFGVVEQGDDGSLVINVGDDYGDVEMKPVSIDEFLSEIEAVDANGEVLS